MDFELRSWVYFARGYTTRKKGLWAYIQDIELQIVSSIHMYREYHSFAARPRVFGGAELQALEGKSNA